MHYETLINKRMEALVQKKEHTRIYKRWHSLPPRRFREAVLSLFSTNAPPDHGLETFMYT
jgi:hypothetical protein